MLLHELICRCVRQALDTASPWLLQLSALMIVVGLLLDRSLRRELGRYARMSWANAVSTIIEFPYFFRKCGFRNL